MQKDKRQLKPKQRGERSISRIALVTETLVTGGAETFVLRLANALQCYGLDVSVCVLRGEKVNKDLVKSIAPGISIVAFYIPFLHFVLKLDGILFRLGLDASLLRWLQVRMLRQHLSSTSANIVHSNLLTCDLVTARATKPLSIPWISTMHGDYLAMEKRGGNSRAARIQSFASAIDEIETSTSHLVCITDPQTEQLTRLLPGLAAQERISKIYNGYATSETITPNDMPDLIASIPSDAFVFGMVSRGVRDKGWEVIISAFLDLNVPNCRLVLVGDGDYVQQVRQTVQDERIIFVGDVVDPLRYIARFDVGCLPSRFKTESLPTVVIEYLHLGKPVIATNVGELPIMLDANSSSPAGLLIEWDSVEAMVEQMKRAMQRIFEDKKLFQSLQSNTKTALDKFNMNICVSKYLALYERAQG